MEIVADAMLVSSSSVMVREDSITEAPSFSVKARVPEAPEISGASFAATVMAMSWLTLGLTN